MPTGVSSEFSTDLADLLRRHDQNVDVADLSAELAYFVDDYRLSRRQGRRRFFDWGRDVRRRRGRPADECRRVLAYQLAASMRRRQLPVTKFVDGLFANILRLVFDEVPLPEHEYHKAVREACDAINDPALFHQTLRLN